MSSSTLPPRAEPPYPRSVYAWYVIGVLIVAYTFSFIDRQILALLGEQIIHDLKMSDFQYGLLSTAFAVLYVVLGIPIGWIADRYSRRTLIAAGIVVWSVMTVASGLTKNFVQLFATRVGVGVGEAALTPPAYSLIADYFPPRLLGRAMGAYGMGVYIGSGLAFIVGGLVVGAVSGIKIDVPIVGELWGWQTAFIIVGLPGLLVALLMFTVKEPFRRGKARTGENIPFSDVMRFAWTHRKTYLPFWLGHAPLVFVSYAWAIWGAPFFIRIHEYPAQDFGLVFGLIVIVMGPAGAIAGGYLGDWWRSRGHADGYLRVALLGAIIILPLIVAVPLMPTPELSFILLVPATFLGALNAGSSPAALQLITPNQMRGQINALHLFVVNAVGLGIGPPLVGIVTEDIFGDRMALGYALSIVSALAIVMALALILYGLKPYRAQVEESQEWAAL
ncbi:MAG: MFS transporter [Proteobacteria bacterium]|nr:MFS transporter [Pseudomonadota bacterium]